MIFPSSHVIVACFLEIISGVTFDSNLILTSSDIILPNVFGFFSERRIILAQIGSFLLTTGTTFLIRNLKAGFSIKRQSDVNISDKIKRKYTLESQALIALKRTFHHLLTTPFCIKINVPLFKRFVFVGKSTGIELNNLGGKG